MKQRLEQIAEANNWAFNYGRLDFLNLPTTHSNEFYFFADAIEETIKYDDFSNIESKTYSGRFWLCLKSDFDRVYNNQENNTTSVFRCCVWVLSEEREDVLRQGVGLCEHRGTGLLEDLGASELGGFAGVVGVHDAAAGGLGVFPGGGELGQDAFETGLNGAEGGAVGVNRVDGGIEGGHGSSCGCCRRNVAERAGADGSDGDGDLRF